MRTEKTVVCEICNASMMPITYLEYEFDEKNIPTGRRRRVYSRLECPRCLRSFKLDEPRVADAWA